MMWPFQEMLLLPDPHNLLKNLYQILMTWAKTCFLWVSICFVQTAWLIAACQETFMFLFSEVTNEAEKQADKFMCSCETSAQRHHLWLKRCQGWEQKCLVKFFLVPSLLLLAFQIKVSTLQAVWFGFPYNLTCNVRSFPEFPSETDVSLPQTLTSD